MKCVCRGGGGGGGGGGGCGTIASLGSWCGSVMITKVWGPFPGSLTHHCSCLASSLSKTSGSLRCVCVCVCVYVCMYLCYHRVYA